MVLLLLHVGPLVSVFSGEEPGGLCYTAVLKRCSGQTDPGWGLTCTTCCVTLGKLLELSKI